MGHDYSVPQAPPAGAPPFFFNAGFNHSAYFDKGQRRDTERTQADSSMYDSGDSLRRRRRGSSGDEGKGENDRRAERGSVGRQKSFKVQYDIRKKLGEGSFAVVHECIRKNDHEHLAVKVFKKKGLRPKEAKLLLQEVAILRELEHPNVLHLEDFLEDRVCYYLITDLVRGGELFDRIVAKCSYTEKEARDLFVIVTSAVRYLHNHDVVHRDLKPENLLLKDPKDDVTVVIADFGFADKVDGNAKSLTKICGTPSYTAPEILNRLPYGKAIDMWSLGVITYILLAGYPPFFADEPRELYRRIREADFGFFGRVWLDVSCEAKDLITGLLDPDADRRLTADQALNHPWVRMDAGALDRNNLEASKQELKRFNARRKFRAGVQTVIAANKFSLLYKLKHVTNLRRKQEEADAAAAPPCQEEQPVPLAEPKPRHRRVAGGVLAPLVRLASRSLRSGEKRGEGDHSSHGSECSRAEAGLATATTVESYERGLETEEHKVQGGKDEEDEGPRVTDILKELGQLSVSSVVLYDACI